MKNLLEIDVYKNSLRQLATPKLLESLRNRCFLVSGASGMIGSALVDLLIFLNNEFDVNIKIIAISRDRKKLEERFGAEFSNESRAHLFPCSVDLAKATAYDALSLELERHGIKAIDFVVHAASPADPASFDAHPVEVAMANVYGLDALCRVGVWFGDAKTHEKAVESKIHSTKKQAKNQDNKDKQKPRLLYISSGEFYGASSDSAPFSEDFLGYIDHSRSRSCYPASKRMGEVLCASYAKEYALDYCIARPCHIFGPTQTSADSRVLSVFFKTAAGGKDIILHSSGSMRRSHCYTLDCANALVFILLFGESGEAYNIADLKYEMSIAEFAKDIVKAENDSTNTQNIRLVKEMKKSDTSRHLVRPHALLDASKLLGLGWQPRTLDAVSETLKVLKAMRGMEE